VWCIYVCVCVHINNSPQNSVYFKTLSCSVQIISTFYAKGALTFKYPPRTITVNVSSNTTNTKGGGSKALSIANQRIGAHVHASSRTKQGKTATYLTANNS